MKDEFAFPISTIDGYTHYGMTLRDYFAANALNGLLAHGVQRHEAGESARSDWYASTAYQIADAMLAERAK